MTTIKQKLFLNGLSKDKNAGLMLKMAQSAGMNLDHITIIRKQDGSVDLIEKNK